MTINRRHKGWRSRRKCVLKLEKAGWVVDVVEKTGRFRKNKDLFGLYDLCCIKPGVVLFIQVTSTRPHVHKPYHEFANVFGGEQIWIEQWVWINYEGFERHIYYPGGRRTKLKII